MYVDSVRAGAVEIPRERPERALEVRRTAGYVIPGISDLVSRGRIKRQRIAIAIERAVERHAGIDSVIQSALYNIGELGISSDGKHAPVPHHIADGGAAFAVGAEIRQLVGIPESFPIRPRTDPAGDIHLSRGRVVPEIVQRLQIGWISGLHVIVGCPATGIHCPDGVPFHLGPRSERSSTEHVNGPPLRQLDAFISLQDVTGEVKLTLVTRDAIEFD